MVASGFRGYWFKLKSPGSMFGLALSGVGLNNVSRAWDIFMV